MRNLFNKIKNEKDNLSGILSKDVKYDIVNKNASFRIGNRISLSISENTKNSLKESENTVITLSFEEKPNIGYLNLFLSITKEYVYYQGKKYGNKIEKLGHNYLIEIDNKDKIRSIDHMKECGHEKYPETVYESLYVNKNELKILLDNFSNLTEDKKEILKLTLDFSIEDSIMLDSIFNKISAVLKKIENQTLTIVKSNKL